MSEDNVATNHTPKVQDKRSESEIVEAAGKHAQKFGSKITKTWTEGKGNPVEQLDKALDAMQFVSITCSPTQIRATPMPKHLLGGNARHDYKYKRK